jgi:uncharacterized protein (TIGR02677 family)
METLPRRSLRGYRRRKDDRHVRTEVNCDSQADANVDHDWRVEISESESPGGLGDERSAEASTSALRLGAVRQFDYLGSGTPLAGTYRAIMVVFLANRDTFGLGLATDEVLTRLRASGLSHEAQSVERLEGLLENLEQYGNVRRSQDTSLARTITELARKRSLWRITEEGRLAEQAARAVEAAFKEQGGLRSNVLGALRGHLSDLAGFVAKPSLDPDDGRVLDTLFVDVFTRTEQLAQNASTFIDTLDSFLESPEISTDAFVLVRDAIVGYVSDFLSDLRVATPVVATAIETIESTDVERLIHAAASSDPPPTFDGSDPIDREATVIRQRWAGVRRWFVGAPGEPATSRFLADRAAAAITTLLRVLGRLNDARHRRISRARDFVALARWFDATPVEATAHRIWHAVFGLSSARHLRTPLPDEDAIEGIGSWWVSPPVPIEPRLRSIGVLDNRGRPGAIEDTSAAQAILRARIEVAEARRADAVTRFLDAGPVRLSAMPELTDAEFDLILDCLAAALGTVPEPDGSIITPSLDGRYLVGLTSPATDEPFATIWCPRGSLRSLDYALELLSATAEAQATEVAAS